MASIQGQGAPQPYKPSSLGSSNSPISVNDAISELAKGYLTLYSSNTPPSPAEQKQWFADLKAAAAQDPQLLLPPSIMRQLEAGTLNDPKEQLKYLVMSATSGVDASHLTASQQLVMGSAWVAICQDAVSNGKVKTMDDLNAFQGSLYSALQFLPATVASASFNAIASAQADVDYIVMNQSDITPQQEQQIATLINQAYAQLPPS